VNSISDNGDRNKILATIFSAIDEKLNKLKGKNLAPEVLKEANENLSRIKNLKDLYK
jgi:hypothetical protein